MECHECFQVSRRRYKQQLRGRQSQAIQLLKMIHKDYQQKHREHNMNIT